MSKQISQGQGRPSYQKSKSSVNQFDRESADGQMDRQTLPKRIIFLFR